MSNLSFMEKLLDGVEVEWKALWEVTIWDKKFNAVENFKQSEVIKYHYFLAKDFKPLVVEGGNVKLLTTNISELYTTKELAGDKIAEGEVVAIPWGGNAVIQYYKGKFLTSDNRIATSNNINYLNNRYLYYFLLNNIQLIESFYRGSGIKHPSMASILDMEIPIPAIEIQAEIVRILDAFTELTAELTTELTARKKQYNYYRDQLLSFEERKVEWITLGEVGEFIRGKRFTKKDYVEDGGIKAIHYGEIYTHYGTSSTSAISQVRSELAESLRYAETNDVIVASVGETIEDVGKAVAWLGDEKVAIHDDSYAIRHSLNPKYLSYCLQTEGFIAEKAKHVSRGKVKRLLIDGISKVRIAIPYPNDPEKSLAEQARIVAILDKFDTLTNSISEGLPREIELRQKQYEYYLDLLLSFPKYEEVAA
jgi:type I restriction enzyme S subunit